MLVISKGPRSICDAAVFILIEKQRKDDVTRKFFTRGRTNHSSDTPEILDL